MNGGASKPTPSYHSVVTMFSTNDPARQAWLEHSNGKTFYLRERTTVGRQPSNDLGLSGETLSRQHAVITAGVRGYVITDQQSRNGTYVAGQLINRPTTLRDNDEIKFGDVEVRFRCTRNISLLEATEHALETTQMLKQVQSRDCWLLVADVEGYTALVTASGNEAAQQRLQDWTAGARPLVEQHAGRISRYIGDAILVYWPCATTKPADVLASLRAFESWRPRSPMPFRLVIHQGPVLFSKSEHGEELGGRDVTLVFRMEKIAKGFGSRAMLSPTAVQTLGIEAECESYGRSAVDGMSDFFDFYGLPASYTAAP
jgi:class 3 adenylate cyclase